MEVGVAGSWDGRVGGLGDEVGGGAEEVYEGGRDYCAEP